mmetsp:Transcript_38414/g.73841  ORF Transcript_38414/g.73841 Transcript_38414/m.73841 type:complete len:100 (-) Transcript_38414:387-686(-)
MKKHKRLPKLHISIAGVPVDVGVRNTYLAASSLMMAMTPQLLQDDNESDIAFHQAAKDGGVTDMHLCKAVVLDRMLLTQCKTAPVEEDSASIDHIDVRT